MVPLLGEMFDFCLHDVGELGFMSVLINSDGVEVVIDCWHPICDVVNRRMMF